MKIRLDQIKVANNELRKEYDAKSLQDLTWSLMEAGQVEPIKVSQNGSDSYEIVYGHRRYKAAYNAGWDEIEAIVVSKDEKENLIQAGIENLAKEDLTAMEKATWAERLIDSGMSLSEIGRKSTVPTGTLSQLLLSKREFGKGVCAGTNLKSIDGYVKIIAEIHRALGEDMEAKNEVFYQVYTKKYNRDQARALAEAYKHAETPELKEAVLNMAVGKNATWEDVLHNARFRKVMIDQFPKTFVFIPKEENAMVQGMSPFVRKFYGSINSTRKHILLGPLFVREELFTPEQANFTINKINATIAELNEYKESLKGVK